jgi:hypothetical protein
VRKTLASLTAAVCSVPIAFALMASDHKDGPNTTADQPADITDLYAWHNSTAGTFTTVLDFAGLRNPGQPAIYDPNVLYAIHITSTSPTNPALTTTSEIDFRFAQNAAGGWGVQAIGVPGSSGPISGTVESNISDGPRMLYAGLRDDPFFFDLDGFHTAVMTGIVTSMKSTHDTFAGTNVTAIVLQMALSDVTVGNTQTTLSVWASTGRMPEANARVKTVQADDRLAVLDARPSTTAPAVRLALR